MPQRRIGLTGGIATGKSTVAHYLHQRYGVPVLDADAFSREAVASGSPILGRVAERYGPQLLQTDGALDRRRLGDIVFSNPVERRWLEHQIHPYVRHRFEQHLAELQTEPAVVLMIPLLFEAGLTGLCDDIWVVACREDTQIERLCRRDSLTPDQARQRLAAQMPIEDKCALADRVLTNDSSLQELQFQVDRAWSHPF